MRRRLAPLALAALLLCGCVELRLRFKVRAAVATAPTCPPSVAPWCTTPEERGRVYFTGHPFTQAADVPTPFCRCPWRAR